MPGPFPGMDPWLEGEEVFPCLHNSLIFLLMEAINAAVPAGYVATSANRVWVDDETQREPDVSVFGRDGGQRPPGLDTGPFTRAGMLAVTAGRVREPWEEPYLEIRSARGRRLVTAVEVVSVANKAPGRKGRGAYQQKQDEYWLSGVSLVEIDLLRRGPHTTAVPWPVLRAAAGAFDYHVCITPAGERDEYLVTPVRLADPLPRLLVPLDPGVPPVGVALQPLVDRCYDSGRCAELVDYRRPPDPPLTADQQAWAEGVLRAKGLIP